MGQFSNKLVKVLSFQKIKDFKEPEPEVPLEEASPTKVVNEAEDGEAKDGEEAEPESPAIKKKKTKKE
jgi:hypothetical protein